MIRFLQPWWLLVMLPVAAVAAGYLWRQWRRRADAVRFSNTELLRLIAPAGLGWRRHLAPAAFLLALVALTGALARPAMDRTEPVERANIVLAIDVSLSMEAEDVEPSRLAAAPVITGPGWWSPAVSYRRPAAPAPAPPRPRPTWR